MTGGELLRRKGRQELALARFARGAVALDERRDLRAVDADIGERPVVKRHQFGIGLLPAAPFREGVARSGEETEEEHGAYLSPLWCNAKMRFGAKIINFVNATQPCISQ